MNIRILILNPDNLIPGDRYLRMVIDGKEVKGKLQMEYVDNLKNKLWIDVPFEVEKR